MPPLRRKPIRSSTSTSSSRATAAATTAPATQTVSEASSTPTAVRPVPPATLSLADALPEEPTPAMLLEEEALSSETSGSSEGSLLSTLEELEEEEEPVTPTRPSKPSYTNSSSSKSISQRRNSVVPSEARRWNQTSIHRSSQPAISRKAAAAAAAEPAHVSQLRAKIFPTLYAIFQQSRGGQDALKIRNRTLRSLTKSCLYHREEAKLERTLSDAEALFEKYCARQRQTRRYLRSGPCVRTHHEQTNPHPVHVVLSATIWACRRCLRRLLHPHELAQCRAFHDWPGQ
ncbi:33K [Porcine adenovirus 3]|uniref:33k n=1 Tax=Porcine adenovirus A serotype 3 TaxID=35265 RepID=Q3HS75_ADEP3|nr:33K [Porcine adenovirus 3]ABA46367.1 33k [Porcine adenovirus 3]